MTIITWFCRRVGLMGLGSINTGTMYCRQYIFANSIVDTEVGRQSNQASPMDQYSVDLSKRQSAMK